ncbi:MAG: hypothetical protein RMY64_35665 [Nostoc sp. DedQUE08]|uniref:hypothetical protein n=1 Tax=Nostoc sp. DedQUE08 TaxID=3075393 RepID=UPI002AD21F10|nr:hypothetical protein [Nostoc sp. DedQUE08]MDZ8070377.1 hypothetical protein [Nostoc sp. DedQUE08]MDZ8070897.1 hypothetical protein [Nostoc sp. DedQUE08]
MSGCGVSGTWNLITRLYNTGNRDYTETYPGFADDNPILVSASPTMNLISSCDGRIFLANWGNGYIVSKSFVPNPSEKYDCVNGACIKKSVYSTPGIYQSLSDCEVACGTGCSGQCISNSDWAQIEGLSSQLKNRNCG